MLKFESVAKVGQFIKAMDFRPMEDRDDSFVIGKIISKGRMFAKYCPTIEENDRQYYIGEGYTIECRYDTEGERVRREIHVPFEMSGFSEFDNRVQYVSDGAMRKITTGR